VGARSASSLRSHGAGLPPRRPQDAENLPQAILALRQTPATRFASACQPTTGVTRGQAVK